MTNKRIDFHSHDLLKIIGGIGLLGVLPTMNSCSLNSDKDKPAPNIILVYADDLDFDEISIYPNREFPSYNGMKELGLYRPDQDDTASSHFQNQRFLPEGEMAFYDDPRMYMPTIESLAENGAVFNRFYVTSAICTPSRYGMITGRYASRADGVVNYREPGNVVFNSELLADEGNFAKEMKACGYETGFVGKWHNGLPDQGQFRETGRLIRNNDPEDPETKKIYQKFYFQNVEYIKQTAGFDVVDRVSGVNKEGLPVPEKMRVHNIEWITDGAIEFIENDRESPFFLYMALTVPHGRYYSDWIKDDPLATPAGMLKERPSCMPPRDEIVKLLEEKGIDDRNAMATLIDFSLAALVKSLEEKGLDDNTVIIFVSDHQSRGKNTVYEGSRVPMFVWWGDKIKAGTQVNEICANIDMTSTLVDIAGGEISETNPQDGKSFLPLLLGKQEGEFRDALLLECGFSRALVTKKYKYIANRPPDNILQKLESEANECMENGMRRRIGWSGVANPHRPEPGIWFYADRDFPHYFDKDQIYDLENDFFEQNNIIETEEGQNVLPEMKAMLGDLMDDMPYEFGEFTEK